MAIILEILYLRVLIMDVFFPHDEELLSYAWSRLTLSLVQWEGGGGGVGMERGLPSRSSPSPWNRRLHLVALLSPSLLCRMAV